MSNQSAGAIRFLCLCVFSAFSFTAGATDRVWILDPTFHLNALPALKLQGAYVPFGPITSVALQLDGKIVLAGGIVSDNGAFRAFARLLPNGEVDPDFLPGRTVASVSALTVSAQQNIYTVGMTDDSIQSIAQYDSHGQTIWSHTLSPRGNFRETLLAFPDGSVLVGGSFTNVGDVQRKYIALINESGALQTQFSPELDGAVITMARQQDGKIIIGGTFASVNGMPRARLARLMPDGQLDSSFDPGALITAEASSIAPLSDGKILVSGNFNRRNGSARDRLLRMNPDGSLDDTFTTDLDEPAYQLVIDSENRIVLAGPFTKVRGAPRNRIARLLADGALDDSFDPGTGPNERVYALAIDANGRYVVGGLFTKIGRRTVNGLARLLPFTSTVAVDFADEIFSAGEQYREAVVQLMRYGPTGSDLTVDFWTDPGADPELAEFKPFSAEVHFGPSDLDKTVIVPFPDDGEVEFTETIPIHCQIRGENYINTAEIDVIDDEQPVTSTGVIPMSPGNAVSLSAATLHALANGRLAFSGVIYTDAGTYGPDFYGVAVLNLDGAPSNFKPASVERFEFAQVMSLLWTADDKLLVSGAFTSINGIPKTNIARFNLDGSLDNTFKIPPATGPIALLPDGKILASFWDPTNSTNPYSLVRLNADGSIDPAFHATAAVSSASQTIPLLDGKILLNLPNLGIHRLLPDGTEDPTFQPVWPFQRDRYTFSGYPAPQIFPQADGKILVQGGFNEVDGIRRPRLARLNADGSLDLSFYAGLDDIQSVFPLPDGRILAKNSWAEPWQILNVDGSPSFDFLVQNLNPLVVLPDGRLLDSSLRIVPLNNRRLSSISFETSHIALTEGDTPREIAVKRTGDLSRTLTIPLYSELIKGDGGNDMTVTPSTLTLAPMQTQSSIQVQALADDSIEIDEHYQIRAGDSSDSFATGLLDVVIEDQNGRPGGARLLPELSNLSDAARLATLDDGSILIGGLSDSPLIIYNPQNGATNTLSLNLAQDRRLILSAASIPGGFLLAGPFLGTSNSPVGVVYRFQSNGTRDTNFSCPPLSFYPRQILPEPSGTIVVAGDYGAARLNADGSIKRIYSLDSPVLSAALISTNRLLYKSYYGIYCFDLTAAHAATGFTRVQISDGGIENMILGGNYFYISGSFTGVNGISRRYLARFTLDGKLDSTYRPVFDGQPRAIALDSKNRLVVFGFFANVNGISRPSCARLNFDGSLDTTFDPDVFISSPEGLVLSSDAISQLPNGDLFAICYIPSFPYRNAAAIITSDLPLRAGVANNNGAFEFRLTTLPQKSYVIETSSNLSDWQSLLATNASAYQLNIPLPPDQPHLFVRAKNSD